MVRGFGGFQEIPTRLLGSGGYLFLADRPCLARAKREIGCSAPTVFRVLFGGLMWLAMVCLLYTSDAADE